MSWLFPRDLSGGKAGEEGSVRGGAEGQSLSQGQALGLPPLGVSLLKSMDLGAGTGSGLTRWGIYAPREEQNEARREGRGEQDSALYRTDGVPKAGAPDTGFCLLGQAPPSPPALESGCQD